MCILRQSIFVAFDAGFSKFSSRASTAFKPSVSSAVSNRSIGSVHRPPPLATRSYAANERFSTTDVTNKNKARKCFT